MKRNEKEGEPAQGGAHEMQPPFYFYSLQLNMKHYSKYQALSKKRGAAVSITIIKMGCCVE